jgi:hypothetical protein
MSEFKKNSLAHIKLDEEKKNSNDEVSLATLDKSSANTIFNILKLPDLDNKKEND